MATIYIEEHNNIAQGILPIAGSPVTVQKITVAGTSAQSTAFTVGIQYIRITTDTACQYELGANPTADANSRYLPAGVPVDIEAAAGDKLAVIQQQ